MKSRSWILVVCLGAAPVTALHADPPRVDDSGTYRVYQKGRALGTETFSYQTRGDSLVVTSHVVQVIPQSESVDTLDKSIALTVGAFDYDLRDYRSSQRFLGEQVVRGLVLEDTVFTAYRELNGSIGVGDRLVRPPGRLFVIDPQVFVLFDVMCRNLHGKSFDSRPVWVLVLGQPDSIFEATAHNLGTETINWGSRQVLAHKFEITDQHTQFLAWVSPRGQMLRLQKPDVGLRVEREGPPVKRPGSRPRSG